jgi:phosphate transport system substrate-binding protein
VIFDISAGGAGKGMTDVLSDAVDIGMVSRSIRPEETEKGAFGVAVVKDAVFPVVNAGNPVVDELLKKGITQDTLTKIFITGEITTWGEVIGDPKVTDEIHVYTRSDAAGAAEMWALFLGGLQEDLLGIAVNADPGLLQAVISDPLGIGYNNLGYAFDITTGDPVAGALVLPIDMNKNGIADPGEYLETMPEAIDAVASGAYPAPPARMLFLVTKDKPSGLARAFIQWVLSDGQQYVRDAGYVQLTAEQIQEYLSQIE